MLILKYELRIFIDNFNKKIRKEATNKEKFSTIKKELKAHLKERGADLTVLPDLKIWAEGYDLYVEYTETTNTRMKLELFWASYIFNKNELDKVANSFMETLKIEEEKRPLITFTDETMRNAYGLYYPDQNMVLMSKKFVQSHNLDLVIKVLKHEILHAFCHIMGIPALDTDEPFIRLLIKYDAYISQEKSAQEAYHNVLNKIMIEKTKESFDVENTKIVANKLEKANISTVEKKRIIPDLFQLGV